MQPGDQSLRAVHTPAAYSTMTIQVEDPQKLDVIRYPE
jgi:hypothetical protein